MQKINRAQRINAIEEDIAPSDAIGRELVRVHREALDGRIEEAGSTLATLIAGSTLEATNHRLSLFLGAALSTLRSDLLEQLLSTRFCPQIQLNVTINSAIHQYFIVLLSKDRQNHIHLTLSSNLMCHPNLENQMTWLIWVMPFIARIGESIKVPEGRAFLNQWDAGVVPGISYCASSDDHFLIPDNVFLPTEGYRRFKDELSTTITDWSGRTQIAFWRGATTGQLIQPQRGWRSLQRVGLCELSQRFPNLLDAGLSKVVQFPADIAGEIQKSGLCKNPYPASKLHLFKYVIDVDGNSNSWSGLFERLSSGCTVLKVTSPRGYKQWYYTSLRPWHNYIPVQADMSDLIEKIEWLSRNDKVAREVGQNGRALAISMDYETEVAKALESVSAAFRAFDSCAASRIFNSSRAADCPVFTSQGTLLGYSRFSRKLVHIPAEAAIGNKDVEPVFLCDGGLELQVKSCTGEYVTNVSADGTVQLSISPSVSVRAIHGEPQKYLSRAEIRFAIDGKFLASDKDGRIVLTVEAASIRAIFYKEVVSSQA